MDDIDRTDEAALSRALEEARDTLELVTVGAADGITIQDARGALVYANLAAARLSGYGSVDEFMAAARFPFAGPLWRARTSVERTL